MILSRVELFDDKRFQAAIKMVAPGSRVREALSYILQGQTGALLVFSGSPRTRKLLEGGVPLDVPFNPMLMYELAKMDGAIILDREGTRIMHANAILQPKPTIPSNETGTRHRAADRLAKQTREVVLAVSKRRNSMTLYLGDVKFSLDPVPTLLNKGLQAMSTLENYKASLDKVLFELSVRELEDLVTIFDVVRGVQRTEMVRRMLREVQTFVIELGSEGRLLALQLTEYQESLNAGIMVTRDYYRDGKTERDSLTRLTQLTSPEVLNLGHVAQCLGYSSNLATVDDYLVPRGYRILEQTHRLPSSIIEKLVGEFGNLRAIMQAPRESLIAVDGVGEVRAERLREGLKLLRNQLVFDLH